MNHICLQTWGPSINIQKGYRTLNSTAVFKNSRVFNLVDINIIHVNEDNCQCLSTNKAAALLYSQARVHVGNKGGIELKRIEFNEILAIDS